MRMVHIRNMRMHVQRRLVTMSVAMRTGWYRIVQMVVVSVVMAVCVFVLRRFVIVLVSV